MVDLNTISPVIPVFTLIGIGFLFARWRKISLDSLTEIIIYLAAPCLAFSSLSAKPLFAADIVVILAGASGILVGVGFLVWVYMTSVRFHSRDLPFPSSS